jgi:hypothetical protein
MEEQVTTQEPEITQETTPAPKTTPEPQGWKELVREDLRNSPLLQKFEDNPDGLSKALESHANLEKLLGHEKVPIPKDINDVEGWNRFSKAMGIPDKADGYGLPDAQVPEDMKGLAFNKQQFAEIVHAHKLTPAQAKGLWETYTKANMEVYANAMKEHKEQLTQVVNRLRGEWGDAYDTNVELGQMVINKFSSDKETNDFITATLTQDPRGVKFLASIGQRFSENKIGDFGYKQFSLTPENAANEIEKITKDPNHPYNNEKATAQEHQAAVDLVNSLYASVNRARG